MEPLPIAVVAAFIRIGKKYECSQLYSDAVKRLRHEFPSQLLAAESSVDNKMILKQTNLTGMVIKLALECNLRSLLPWAYYRFCIREEEGTFFSEILSMHRDTALLLLRGRSKLAARYSEVFCWLDVKGPGEENYIGCCQSRSRCISVRHELLSDMFAGRYGRDVLAPWNVEWEKNLCEDCASTMRYMHHSELHDLWTDLPEAFGLPSWTTLETE